MTTPNNPNDSGDYELPPLPPPDTGAWDRLQQAWAEADAAPQPTPSTRKRLLAGLTSFAVAAGGVGVAVEVLGGHSKPKHVAVRTTPEVPAQGTESSTGNPEIDAAFRRALSVDTCETKVSFEDVTGMYNRVFGATDLATLGPDALHGRSDQIADTLLAERSELALVPLPDKFDELQQDAMDLRKLPIERYQQVLDDYMKQFGIKTLFQWRHTSTPTHFDPNDLTTFAEPISHAELEKSKVAREQIVAIINNFANLPPAVVKEAGIRRLAIGNITKKGAIGEAPLGNGTILFDVSDLGAKSDNVFWSNLGVINSAPAHEVMHQWDYATCFAALHAFSSKAHDRAYESLNGPAFTYGPATVAKLSKTGRVGQLTTLQSTKPGEALVNDPYGATDEWEDKATLFGQLVLDTPNADALYAADQSKDTHILQEKVALVLARVARRDPKLGEFYVHVLQGSRLQQEVYKRTAATEHEALKDPNLTPADIEAKMKPYQGIVNRLAMALGEIPTNTD